MWKSQVIYSLFQTYLHYSIKMTSKQMAIRFYSLESTYFLFDIKKGQT